MDKTTYFKKILRTKHLLKKLDNKIITEEEKTELKKLLDFFGVRKFTKEEFEKIKEKYNHQETSLDELLNDF
ncbi:MAG TPA: hypothetical protein PLP73_00910 [Candidatus Absconditabacterales bacterium]|nr:hypothetical protein [Candidatus Absconditabacterales bacterium]HRU50148.1 hypothetical protein [Candidatus Absconditabacterales bacterium]